MLAEGAFSELRLTIVRRAGVCHPDKAIRITAATLGKVEPSSTSDAPIEMRYAMIHDPWG
jgi:hypothetical protein